MSTVSKALKASAVWYAKQIAANAMHILNGFKYLMLVVAFVTGLRYSNIEEPGAIVALVALLASFVLIDFTKFVMKTCGRVTDDVPYPSKRFTEVDNDGMVSVESSRLQEMMLYVADVEDYLERKGRL